MRPFFVFGVFVLGVPDWETSGAPIFKIPKPGSEWLDFLDFSMVITMTAMGVMEVPFDQVIGVIAMGDSGMTAIGSMDMVRRMAATGMTFGATFRVESTYGDRMLFDHFSVLVVEVTVVDIVDMAVVLDGGVATAWTMDVVMVIVVLAAFCHGRIPWVNVGLGYSVIGGIPPESQLFRGSIFDFPTWFGLSVFPAGQGSPQSAMQKHPGPF